MQKKNPIKLIMKIPPGLTSKAQSSDLSSNKSFKDHMRQQWTSKLMNDLREKGNAFRATAPSRDNVITWVKEAWSFLSNETIISGFVKANLIENVSLSEQVQETIELEGTDSLVQVLENFGLVDELDENFE